MQVPSVDDARTSRGLLLPTRRGSGERETSMWMVVTGHARLAKAAPCVPAHTTHIADAHANAPIGLILIFTNKNVEHRSVASPAGGIAMPLRANQVNGRVTRRCRNLIRDDEI